MYSDLKKKLELTCVVGLWKKTFEENQKLREALNHRDRFIEMYRQEITDNAVESGMEIDKLKQRLKDIEKALIDLYETGGINIKNTELLGIVGLIKRGDGE